MLNVLIVRLSIALEHDSVRVVVLLSLIALESTKLGCSIHAVLVRLLNDHATTFVILRCQHEIVEPTGEAVHLKISREDSRQGGEQFAGLLRTVELIEGVDEAKLRGSELVFVDRSLEKLVVTENDVTLLLALRTPFSGRELRLAVKVET